MSPRTKEQIIKLKEERRNQIMMVALENFAREGYHSTSIDKIAEKAGISKGLVYNYFNSKEELLKSLLEIVFEEFDKMAEEVNHADPKTILRKILNLYFDLLKNKTDFYKLFSMMAVQVSEFRFLTDFVKQKYQEYNQLLTQLLQSAGIENPENEAKILTALFDGIGFQYIIIGESYPLEQYQNYLLKKYCK